MVKKHITSVEEASMGIILKGTGQHIIRVLGALKEVTVPAPLMKEEMTPLADPSVYERYYSGELEGQQEDPTEEHFHPQVPAFFITSEGEPIFLKRDWPDE